MQQIHQLLHFLLNPANYLPLFLLVLAYKIKKKKDCKVIGISIIIYFLFFTSPLVQLLMHSWELRAGSNNNWGPKVSLFVLGTGALRYHKTRGQFELSSSAARFVEGIRLAKQLKSERLIFSTCPDNNDEYLKESESAIKFGEEMGISREVMLQTDESWNTVMEAQQLKKMTSKLRSGDVVIITDAFHMKRALATFHKLFGKVEAYSVNPLKMDWKFGLHNFSLWRMYLHEIVGYLGLNILY